MKIKASSVSLNDVSAPTLPGGSGENRLVKRRPHRAPNRRRVHNDVRKGVRLFFFLLVLFVVVVAVFLYKTCRGCIKEELRHQERMRRNGVDNNDFCC